MAVWVGYPDRLREMKTEFHGGPVAGGTFPAEIWHDFMTSWIGIRDQRDAARGKNDQTNGGTQYVPSAPSTQTGTAPQTRMLSRRTSPPAHAPAPVNAARPV